MNHYKSEQKFQEKALEGVKKLKDIVSSTLGPRGNTVIIQKKGRPPFATKDGVTVSRDVAFEDPFENAAAQIVKQSCEQTGQIVGDGTTTTTVLAHAILEQAQRYRLAGCPPAELKRGIEKTIDKIIEVLEEKAIPIRSKDDIKNIATISANGDDAIGELIAEAIEVAGKDGNILLEEAHSFKTSLSFLEGFSFDSGFMALNFCTDENKGIAYHKDPLFLVTDYIITNPKEITNISQIAARSARPLIIVAENIDNAALTFLALNHTKSREIGMGQGFPNCAIRAPRYGEERRAILKDLAVSVGATFISLSTNKTLEGVTLEDLGSSKSVRVTRTNTIIVDGKGNHEEISKRIEGLKHQIKEMEIGREAEALQERIARLNSGSAVIKIGGATEIEVRERRDRIEDALEAVRSAQEDGILPGGGVALFKTKELLGDNLESLGDNKNQLMGFQAVKDALIYPLKTILDNAGRSVDIVAHKIIEADGGFSFGYDVAKEDYCDLLKRGIIDPCTVTTTALYNAGSVACAILMCNHCIVEE